MLDLKLSGIKVMEEIARGNPEVISLSQGGLKVDHPTHEIKDYVKNVLKGNEADYYGPGAGLLELREDIAEKLSLRHNSSISADQVLISHGCNGALATLIFMLTSPGDEILLPEPAYPSYTNLAHVARTTPVYIPSISKKSWSLPVEEIKKRTTPKTKIILFSNPSNPTSTIASLEDIVELAEWCEKKKIYLIVDEVYEDYIYEGTFSSATSLVNKYSHVIKVSSFSKNFALSGWRVGYMVVPKHLYQPTLSTQDSIFICPSVIGQYAAIAALKNPHIANSFKEYVQYNRDIVLEKLGPLKNMGILDFQKPVAGFYIFIKTYELDATNLCLDIARNAGVTLVPGGAFGPSSTGYLRLCYARHKHILQEGLNRLVDYWKSHV